MASRVAISNLAASKIGTDDQIRSPDDDTHIARTINSVWDIVRQIAIRDHGWNFATRRAQLPALDAPVPYPWTYAYQLPAEALRLREVLNVSGGSDWQLEGRQILSNQAAPLYIRMIIDVTETAEWEPLFVEAFACRLACQIGHRIAGTSFNEAMAMQNYRAAIKDAKRADSIENPRINIDEADDWELARYGGRSGVGLIDWEPSR